MRDDIHESPRGARSILSYLIGVLRAQSVTARMEASTGHISYESAARLRKIVVPRISMCRYAVSSSRVPRPYILPSENSTDFEYHFLSRPKIQLET